MGQINELNEKLTALQKQHALDIDGYKIQIEELNVTIEELNTEIEKMEAAAE